VTKNRLLLVCGLLAFALPLFAQTAPLPPEISKERRAAIDDVFEDWQVAAIDPQSTSCRQNGAPAPALIEGDFNSDGLSDLAVLVKTASGVRLVTVMARVKENNVIDVDAMGDGAAAGILAVAPRGKAYKVAGDKFDDYFTADTLTVTPCGQSTTAYLWNGFAFRKIVLEKTAG
jgi:hypothetical protein